LSRYRGRKRAGSVGGWGRECRKKFLWKKVPVQGGLGRGVGGEGGGKGEGGEGGMGGKRGEEGKGKGKRGRGGRDEGRV